MCQLNGELIVFGGSDESPGTHDTQPASKEVDAYVYHLRPRLRRKPVPSQCNGSGSFGGGNGGGGAVGGGGGSGAGSFPPAQESHVQVQVRHDRALLRWHERAMAKEVVAHMGFVEAAQERRAEAARIAAAVDNLSPRLAALRLAEEGKVAGGASGGGSSRGQGQGLPRFLSTAAEINAHWDNDNSLPQAERGRALSSSERLHQTSARPYGVKVRAIMVPDETGWSWGCCLAVGEEGRVWELGTVDISYFSLTFSGKRIETHDPPEYDTFHLTIVKPHVQFLPCNRLRPPLVHRLFGNAFGLMLSFSSRALSHLWWSNQDDFTRTSRR